MKAQALLLATLFGVTFAISELRAAEIPCDSEESCIKYPGWPSYTHCVTSKFWFSVDSASGARGDVVAVSFFLHFEAGFELEYNGIGLEFCHDPQVAEIVGDPVYAEDLLAKDPIVLDFFKVQEDENPRTLGYGFISDLGVWRDLSPVIGTLPLMTVYYRLVGEPARVSDLTFCNGALKYGLRDCSMNGIGNSRVLGFNWPLLSSRNQPGTLTIVEGPPTHPERPPEPPEAEIYPEPPTEDQVNFRVRVGNAFAVPGDHNVPLDVFLSADVEYTGVSVPIDFDERYLRVTRVEDYFLTGTAAIDNENRVDGSQSDEGYVVITSTLLGKRRIAPAKSEFHAATIYVDVLEAAAEVDETKLELRSVGGRAGEPFVIVRHLGGNAAGQVEARAEIGATVNGHGILAIRPVAETLWGDANFDGVLDISDPISVLSFLFLGDGAPRCLPAADADGDGELVLTDPVLMLGVLFAGQSPPAGRGDIPVSCR